jgi:DNA-binding MarR family transcriptional regulator
MTRLLDRLEGKGLIRRRNHPGDRRSIVIALTGQGRALVPHLAPIFGRVTSQRGGRTPLA